MLIDVQEGSSLEQILPGYVKSTTHTVRPTDDVIMGKCFESFQKNVAFQIQLSSSECKASDVPKTR